MAIGSKILCYLVQSRNPIRSAICNVRRAWPENRRPAFVIHRVRSRTWPSVATVMAKERAKTENPCPKSHCERDFGKGFCVAVKGVHREKEIHQDVDVIRRVFISTPALAVGNRCYANVLAECRCVKALAAVSRFGSDGSYGHVGAVISQYNIRRVKCVLEKFCPKYNRPLSIDQRASTRLRRTKWAFMKGELSRELLLSGYRSGSKGSGTPMGILVTTFVS